MPLLPSIRGSEDIKKLPVAALPELAGEVRRLIIECISRTGGHLASSLGATDLILSLHYMFDTPRDRIVFDTGHQAYAHKILTGRADSFHTIRTRGGLSGFLKRYESEYDAFGAGHASTALSAAAGMAAARDQAGASYKVVAVVADGAMTGGMAWEAMQNVGQLNTDLLVVLNDNQMFISQRVCGFNAPGIAGRKQDGERVGQQGVAGQDGQGLAVNLVAGRAAPAQRVVVHGRQVVVNERVGMQHLYGAGRRQDVRGSAAEDLVGSAHQQRAQALAAGRQRVGHGFGQGGLRPFKTGNKTGKGRVYCGGTLLDIDFDVHYH